MEPLKFSKIFGAGSSMIILIFDETKEFAQSNSESGLEWLQLQLMSPKFVKYRLKVSHVILSLPRFDDQIIHIALNYIPKHFLVN